MLRLLDGVVGVGPGIVIGEALLNEAVEAIVLEGGLLVEAVFDEGAG